MPRPGTLRALVATLATIGLATIAAAPRVAAAQAPSAAAARPWREPPAGSAERTAILDRLRQRLGTRARFQVHALRVASSWAFVHATEVVPLEHGEVQETDLTAMALLERRGAARWTVVELWTLPTDERRSHADFLRAVGRRQRSAGFPEELVPEDVR